MIRIIGPHDKKKFTEQEKTLLIDVTSQSTTWTQVFSPFKLGPVKLYGPYGAFNVENAWQYAKVYKKHATESGEPTDEYWKWAHKGWGKKFAERYPMGRGSIPEYSLWDGEKLGYTEAKRRIYVPLYQKAVYDSGYFESLVQFVWDLQRDGIQVGFFDFDGFDRHAQNMSYEDVINSNRKLGHAMVLAEMVEKALKELNDANPEPKPEPKRCAACPGAAGGCCR